jgi:hypothetical protein
MRDRLGGPHPHKFPRRRSTSERAQRSHQNVGTPDYVAAWLGLLRTLVTRQLMLDQSAVVVDMVGDSQFVLWRETAEHFSARLSLIECVCSDEAVHRARIEGRVRGIPGWHEVGWDHVERTRAEVPPLTVDRLIVDAMGPVEANFRRVLDYIGA